MTSFLVITPRLTSSPIDHPIPGWPGFPSPTHTVPCFSHTNLLGKLPEQMPRPTHPWMNKKAPYFSRERGVGLGDRVLFTAEGLGPFFPYRWGNRPTGHQGSWLPLPSGADLQRLAQGVGRDPSVADDLSPLHSFCSAKSHCLSGRQMSLPRSVAYLSENSKEVIEFQQDLGEL